MQNNADDPFAYLNETRRQFESFLKKRLLALALQTLQHWVNSDPVNPSGGEYKRAQEDSNNGLFRYETSHAWGNFSEWHPGAPLSMYVENGEDAFPASLHWRDQKGHTGSISLQTDMSSYIGYYQRAHEGPIAYQGRLEERIPLSEARRTNQHCQVFTYQAEHSWGENTDEWHPCNDLVFCIESGEGALLVCLDWRDQKGNAGSISFQSDMRSFYGYYQRLGEGPISYQGRLKQEKDQDRDKTNDECLHESDAPSSTLRVIEPFRRADQWYDEGPFDDTPIAYPSGLSIRKFFLLAGDIVDGIQASYGEEHIQLTPPHGNVNLHSTEVVLDPGDSWSEISGFHGSWFGGKYVLQLTFRTRLGRAYGPFGSMNYASESVPFTLRLEPHESIIALKGVVSTGDNGKNSHLGALGLVLGSVVPAEVIDEDEYPGGQRQLVRMVLPGDEDLVVLSVKNTSTGRSYVLRVPPTMQSCYQAAPWTAGFENPDDYQPLIET